MHADHVNFLLIWSGKHSSTYPASKLFVNAALVQKMRSHVTFKFITTTAIIGAVVIFAFGILA